MILVTLGTQDKRFDRLIKAVDDAFTKGYIRDKVVIQAGSSADFKIKNSQYMEIFDLIPMDMFDKLMDACDILITHGGVGSIIAGLNKGKKVIAAARLEKYGEHVNDHQIQIIENFKKAGYILSLENFDDLGIMISEINNFSPKTYQSNAENFRRLIEKKIDGYLEI